ncbi:hypothetical protein SHKM778_28280 [Streptomyces sp. KM77-8]|uniref:AB hydrolase-1 domain-containing protein n=1 Tax=Streptomyces haneummycinicus TaxID=3074435 RepID=A0AAT9HGZ9_9ACTN
MVTARAERAPDSATAHQLLPGYPAPRHWRRVPVTGQHYVAVGSGPPVLFLHGNPSWSYVWRGLLRQLAPHARCVAPDLPGFGLSRQLRPADGVPDPYEAQLEALEGLYRHLVRDEGLPERGWTFVLHDWGGPLGTAWALRNPGVVARMAVCNTVAFPFPDGFRLPFYLRCLRDHRPVAELVHATNAFARIAVRAGVRRPLLPAERRAFLRPTARRAERRAVADAVRAIPAGPPTPRGGCSNPQGREPDWRTCPCLSDGACAIPSSPRTWRRSGRAGIRTPPSTASPTPGTS